MEEVSIEALRAELATLRSSNRIKNGIIAALALAFVLMVTPHMTATTDVLGLTRVDVNTRSTISRLATTMTASSLPRSPQRSPIGKLASTVLVSVAPVISSSQLRHASFTSTATVAASLSNTAAATSQGLTPSSSAPPLPSLSPSPAATVAPAAGSRRYLIIGREMRFGRYSNQRMSVADAAGLASFTGRSLLLPRCQACTGGVSETFDLEKMSAGLGVAVAEDAGAALPPECTADSSVLIYLDSYTKVEVGTAADRAPRTEYRGVSMPVVDSRTLQYDPAVMAALTDKERALLPQASNGHLVPDETMRLARSEPFASYYPLRYLSRDLDIFMYDHMLPYRLAALPHACVVVDVPFLGVNWAMIPGYLPRVASAMMPAPALEAAVQAWFKEAGVEPGTAVAAHLRLGDMVAGFNFGFANRCVRNPSFAIEALRELQARVAAANAPLLVASDDLASPCTTAILAAFPNHKVVNPPSGAGDCFGVAFVHEVLGRTSGLLGNSLSTFSIAAHWIRLARYNAAPNTTIWPEGPDMAPFAPGRGLRRMRSRSM